MREKNKCERRK